MLVATERSVLQIPEPLHQLSMVVLKSFLVNSTAAGPAIEMDLLSRACSAVFGAPWHVFGLSAKLAQILERSPLIRTIG